MMLGEMTTAQLERDIARDRSHVAKQHAIIAQLAETGHTESLATAKAVLHTLHSRLLAEVEMLIGMAPI